MKKILSILWMSFLMVGNVSASEFAQKGSVEIGAFGGYGFYDDYAGNNPENNFLYGARLGYFVTDHVSFEPSFQLSMTDTDRAVGANTDVTFRGIRFNLLYHFIPKARFTPFLTGGLGYERATVDPATSDDLGVNAGLGLRVFLSDSIALRAEGRAVYAEVREYDERQYNYETMLGLSFFFGGAPAKDSDGDGVIDEKDQCANTPSGATVDLKGCPTDSDGDGVSDGIDRCPKTLKGLLVNEQGCEMDTDLDGVPDGADQCPETPENVDVDAQGCPMDEDQDGVGNADDRCPKTPKGAPVDQFGCPKDSDEDGVADHLDQCPDTAPETKVDAKGCPLVTKSRGVLQGVFFRTGSAELTENSKVVLNDVAKDLNEFPKVRVEIQGHTDSTGPDEVNQRVSQARADSVRAYLISQGVAEDRLDAKGYGESLPVADNKTADGRAKNRRVELVWLD